MIFYLVFLIGKSSSKNSQGPIDPLKSHGVSTIFSLENRDRIRSSKGGLFHPDLVNHDLDLFLLVIFYGFDPMGFITRKSHHLRDNMFLCFSKHPS